MNKLEAIKKKCIEANPSIMDLVFGCRVTDSYGDIHIIIKGQPEFKIYETSRGTVNVDTIKILGREIRLCDILLTINSYISIDNDGSFRRGTTLLTQAKWNLFKDSLDDQSDELIAFLYQLLCE